MSTNFPGALDTTANLPPIGPDDGEDEAGKEHDVQHTSLNAAMLAVQAKVGADNSDDPNSIDYRMKRVQTTGVSLGGALM